MDAQRTMLSWLMLMMQELGPVGEVKLTGKDEEMGTLRASVGRREGKEVEVWLCVREIKKEKA